VDHSPQDHLNATRQGKASTQINTLPNLAPKVSILVKALPKVSAKLVSTLVLKLAVLAEQIVLHVPPELLVTHAEKTVLQ
jgi:hypothetical protein